jgi:hypothetical protein
VHGPFADEVVELSEVHFMPFMMAVKGSATGVPVQMALTAL